MAMSMLDGQCLMDGEEIFDISIIQDKLKKSENVSELSERANLIFAEAKKCTRKLNLQRATFKRKITIIINNINTALANDSLNLNEAKTKLSLIDKYVENVNEFDTQILELYYDKDLFTLGNEFYDYEINSQCIYHETIQTKLDNLKSQFLQSQNNPELVRTNRETVRNMVNEQKDFMDLRPPVLHCMNFGGSKGEDFRAFWLQFQNVIGCRPQLTDSSKLTYLKSYLRGYAYQVVQHLPNDNAEYEVAIGLLEKEFLDIPYIIDGLLANILDFPIIYENNLEQLKIQLNNFRSYIYSLRSHNVDFLLGDCPGSRLLSHIVTKKLPQNFKQELYHINNNIYPSINEIIDNFVVILRKLETDIPKRESQFSKSHASSFKRYPGEGNLKERSYYQKNMNEGLLYNSKTNMNAPVKQVSLRPATLQNFKTHVNQNVSFSEKPCKFCSGGHRLWRCMEYPTLQSRKLRCGELNICTGCTATSHREVECPGRQNNLSYGCYTCGQRTHISSLCDKNTTTIKNSVSNLSLTHSNIIHQQYLLPLIQVNFVRRGKLVKVNCLMDTGSQRSYIGTNVLTKLNFELDNIKKQEYNIKTFLGNQKRFIQEISIETFINPKHKFQLPILVDDKLELSFQINGLKMAIQNISEAGYKLASQQLANVNCDNLTNIDCLLGVDFLQFLPQWELIRCMKGSAFRCSQGIIPMGNIQNFLNPEQIRTAFAHRVVPSHHINNTSQVDTIINSILEPKSSYFDPLSFHKLEPSVETGLEYLYSLESIGITNNGEESTLDQLKIEQFRKGIQFSECKYHVELPWKDELISTVPSNHHIALKSLDRVIYNLANKDLVESYNKVFLDLLQDNIIEQFHVDSIHYNDYVFIPHRPIIKNETTTSTKIRPVFNCSLKIGGSLSLNQASYPGINLLTGLLKLLTNFRSNKYVFMGDIRKAFLMIRLKLEADKRRMCFFWRFNGELKLFRFLTIPFGLSSSPFILNYVIKHHCSQYDDDLCNQVLNNNFYVDNLLWTNNDPLLLMEMYKQCCKRMSEGGFKLRAWATNLAALKDIFIKDGTGSTHSEPYEKVLGYLYYPSEDTMKLANFEIDSSANTKRQILSETSKQFDPLNMFAPVTVGSKILLRNLWESNLSWDAPISAGQQGQWRKLAMDLEKIKSLRFKRCAVHFENSNMSKLTLNIFTDASSKTYGFCVYVASDIGNNLVFSKVKMAPLKNNSVPTLELLAVFLAFKTLPSIIESYSNQFSVNKINIFIDAQLVLNWLLSPELKTPKIFIRNRIKEIHAIEHELNTKHNVNLKYHYVHTSDNVADMLTRGISFKEFNNKYEIWMHGPSWLNVEPSSWPRYELNCLSDLAKPKLNIINHSTLMLEVGIEDKNPIIDIYKYSDFDKLFRITNYVFKFLYNCQRKEVVDINIITKLYWIKQSQASNFSREIDFIKKSKIDKDEKVPNLLSNLNLFLDDQDILRSKGRIAKCNYYDYNVINPILLSKNHHFTNLLISNAHMECKHLGINSTLNYIRLQGYWITKARQAVKNIIGKCMLCRKLNTLAFRYPKLTNIAAPAMKLVKVYDKVGIDFTGGIWLTNINNSCTRYYILLYTCMTIRAIHLELLPDMSTKTVLMSFQRFSHLYGVPSQLFSDNYTSFIKAGQMLSEALTSSEFQEHLRRSEIKHIRIAVNASWQGSAWERQIKTVKQCLYKTIGREKLSYFEMLTQLSSVQNAINSRPLTYRSAESNLIPITPNSFLKLHSRRDLIFKESFDEVLPEQIADHNVLNESLVKQYELFNKFKECWKEEYLLSLREFARDLYQTDWTNKIRIGDVVLIKNSLRTRPFWSMGRVLELIYGSDGIIRSVKLKRGSDEKIAHYTINYLYPLEINITHSAPIPIDRPNLPTEVLSDEVNMPSVQAEITQRRPQRKTAERCRQFIKDNLHNL